MRSDEATRASRIARLKLSTVIALVIVGAVLVGVVLKLIEWL